MAKKKYGVPISGKRLHNFLIDHDITRQELDRKLGTSHGYTGRLITRTANMNPSLYRILCQRLNVDSSYFRTKEPEPHLANPGMGRPRTLDIAEGRTVDATIEGVVKLLANVERDLIMLSGQQDQIIKMLGTVFATGAEK